MSIIYNNTEEKTELQKRITAELREKQAKKSSPEGTKKDTSVDLTRDSEYTKDLKATTPLAWIWSILLVAAVAVAIYIATMNL